MTLFAVVLVVIILALIASFAPIDANFKRLLYFIAAGIVVVYLLLLLFGVAGMGWPRGRVVVD